MTDCFTYKIHLLMVCRLACVKNEKCIFCFSFLYLLDSVGFNNSLLRSICCVTKLISWLPMNLSCCSFCILVFSAFVVTSVFFFSMVLWTEFCNYAYFHHYLCIFSFFNIKCFQRTGRIFNAFGSSFSLFFQNLSILLRKAFEWTYNSGKYVYCLILSADSILSINTHICSSKVPVMF